MRFIKKWGILLSVIGLIDSGYLSWIKISHTEEKCISGLGNCAAVNTSIYSELFNIPVAYFGFATYVAILLLLLSGRNYKRFTPYLLFGITLVGVLFTIYLIYAQFDLLKTFCPYCLLSAITISGLFIISTINLVMEINS
jgi:uncharacterized membrane protein